jgi:hypothetical protein
MTDIVPDPMLTLVKYGIIKPNEGEDFNSI